MAIDRADFNRLASALASGRVEAASPPSNLPESLLTLGQEERFRQFDSRISIAIDRVTAGLGFFVDVVREFNEPGNSKYSPGLMKYKLSLTPVRPVTVGDVVDEDATYACSFLYDTARVLSEDPQADIVSSMKLDKTFHNYDEKLAATVTDFDLGIENPQIDKDAKAQYSVDDLNLWHTDLDVEGLPSHVTMVIDYGPFSDEMLERYIFAVTLNAVVNKE